MLEVQKYTELLKVVIAKEEQHSAWMSQKGNVLGIHLGRCKVFQAVNDSHTSYTTDVEMAADMLLYQRAITKLRNCDVSQ